MNLRPSLTAAAASQALLMTAMEKPEERVAKRKLWEDVAYAHYMERWNGLEAGAYVGEPMTQEQFCQRNPDKPEHYYFGDLNIGWWGFQAGYTAAMLVGAKEPS